MAISDELKIIIQSEVDKAVRDLKNLGETTDRSTRSFQSMSRTLLRSAAAFAGVSLSIATVSRLMSQSIRAYADLERAEVALGVAIRATGMQAEISMHALREYAGQLQSVGIFGADVTMSAMATLQSLSSLDQQGLKKVTPAMQDFAAAMGMDLSQAARMFASEIEGTGTALRRYGIVLDSSLSESERMEQLVREVERRFGGMNREMAAAASGGMVQLRNSFSDLQARIGQSMTESANPFLRWLTEIIDKSVEATDRIRLVGRALSGDVGSPDEATAALQAQLSIIEELTEEIEKQRRLGMGGASRANQLQRELEAARENVPVLERMVQLAEKRAEIAEREAENERRRLAAIREREEREQEENRRHETAAEYRRRISEEYARKTAELEADAFDLIEMRRRDALDEAARNYVRTGEEILQINRYYDALLAQEKDRIAEEDLERERRKREALEAEGERLSRSLRTPWEEYADSVERVNELHAAGVIDNETRNRALAAYADDLERATRAQEQLTAKTAEFSRVAGSTYTTSRSFAEGYYRAAGDLERNRHQIVLNNMQRELAEHQSGYQDQLRVKRALGEDTVQFEEDHKTKRAEIEADLEEKRREIAKKEFERQKETSVTQATISGAEAVVRTYAQLGFPAGIPAATAVAGLTAGQVSMIQSQTFPGLYEGGIVRRRGLYEVAEREPEAVIPLSRAGDFGLDGRAGVQVVVNNNGTIVGSAGMDEFIRMIERRWRKLERKGVLAA